jgi:glycosyltransferase involved in cell wall biosynthesis
VLVAQRLEPEKQTRDALATWAKSDLASDGWLLRIAGDGSERRSLEHSVKSRGLQGIEFLGELEDLSEVRQSAGILLAPAPRESFGFSVAEAMAAGLPVVAVGSGGHLETVGASRSDLVYPPGDLSAAARVLRSLSDDLEARRRAGRDLRAFQQRALTLERHVDALTDCYRALARPRHRREEAVG